MPAGSVACGQASGAPQNTFPVYRGTDGSNPSPSSSEPYANLNSSICELRPRPPDGLAQIEKKLAVPVADIGETAPDEPFAPERLAA
jgi:hypothetical protein